MDYILVYTFEETNYIYSIMTTVVVHTYLYPYGYIQLMNYVCLQ